MRRRYRARPGTVPRLQRLVHRSYRPLTLANLLERADHRADLVLEEGTRAGAHGNLAAGAGDVETVERLHRRARLAFGRAKGGEIVLTDKQLGSLVHAVTRASTDAEAPIRIAMPSGILVVGASVQKVNGEWHAEQGAFFRTQRRMFDGYVYVRASRVPGLVATRGGKLKAA